LVNAPTKWHKRRLLEKLFYIYHHVRIESVFNIVINKPQIHFYSAEYLMRSVTAGNAYLRAAARERQPKSGVQTKARYAPFV
jgi:hypothetical protein